MLKSLGIRNFTLFGETDFQFGSHLNVFVGENSAGKTHVLKLAYSVLAMSAEEGRRGGAVPPSKTLLQTLLATKLVNVFRPESLGRLAKRQRGRQRCDIAVNFTDRNLDIGFNFATQSKTEVVISEVPGTWLPFAPAYLPTRELLTIYPGFVALYESHYLQFEETWRDTCILLGAPLKRGVKSGRISKLLEPLEHAMEGSIYLDPNGSFYLDSSSGRMEIPLVAEGLRKLGMLARLIATGALLDKGCLFWDEPEANLNPRIIKRIARCIFDLSREGIQVFIATHSLFLLRELHILQAQSVDKLDVRFFGLHRLDDGVSVKQGDDMGDIGDIAALDEDLEQSDRYIDVETGAAMNDSSPSAGDES